MIGNILLSINISHLLALVFPGSGRRGSRKRGLGQQSVFQRECDGGRRHSGQKHESALWHLQGSLAGHSEPCRKKAIFAFCQRCMCKDVCVYMLYVPRTHGCCIPSSGFLVFLVDCHRHIRSGHCHSQCRSDPLRCHSQGLYACIKYVCVYVCLYVNTLRYTHASKVLWIRYLKMNRRYSYKLKISSCLFM